MSSPLRRSLKQPCGGKIEIVLQGCCHGLGNLFCLDRDHRTTSGEAGRGLPRITVAELIQIVVGFAAPFQADPSVAQAGGELWPELVLIRPLLEADGPRHSVTKGYLRKWYLQSATIGH